MTAVEHLSLDDLSAYLADPDAGASKTASLHLVRCTNCRSRLHALAAMKRFRPSSGEAVDPTGLRPGWEEDKMMADQTIADYMEGLLSGGDKIRIRRQLAERPAALKAAFHNARHRTAMDRALRKAPTATERAGDAASRQGKAGRLTATLAVVKAWLIRRIPLWTAIPAGALVAGGMATCLFIFFASPVEHLQIAHYRDSPEIRFSSPHEGPGLGFFHTIPARRAPFQDVRVSLDGEGIVRITWPNVPLAEFYRIQVVRYANGAPIKVREVTTTETRVNLEGLEILPGQRYVWMLSGSTTDKSAFHAEGGFVFHRMDL